MMIRSNILVIISLFVSLFVFGQGRQITWTPDGMGFLIIKDDAILKVDPKTETESTLFSKTQLTAPGTTTALSPQSFEYSPDKSKLLLFTNTAKVWRYKTRGDYWVLNIAANQLKKLGQTLPSQSLMFAKFSPDG